MRWRVSGWLIGVTLMATTAFAQAQATTGQVTGRIVDQTDLPLPGVVVRVSNDQTGFVREVTGKPGFRNPVS